jgi:hypothetical protein
MRAREAQEDTKMDSVFIVTRVSDCVDARTPFEIVAVYADQELAEKHAKADPSVEWTEEPVSRRLLSGIE